MTLGSQKKREIVWVAVFEYILIWLPVLMTGHAIVATSFVSEDISWVKVLGFVVVSAFTGIVIGWHIYSNEEKNEESDQPSITFALNFIVERLALGIPGFILAYVLINRSEEDAVFWPYVTIQLCYFIAMGACLYISKSTDSKLTS